MKKTILPILTVLIVIFITGCKKDHSATHDQTSPKYIVNFNVGDLSQQIVDINKSSKLKVNATSHSDSLAMLFGSLSYWVKGSASKHIIQKPGDSNYGTFLDTLAAGTYTISIIGGQTGLKFFDPNASYYSSKYDPVSFQTNAPLDGPPGDTFRKLFTITVPGADLNQTVTLTRIVGKLEINIEDPIPATVTKIAATVKNEVFGFNIFYADSVNSYNAAHDYLLFTQNVTAGDVNSKLSTLMFNTRFPFNVELIAYDAANNIIADRIITNISCYKNKKTSLSGKLFGGTSTAGGNFVVTINPTWDPTPIQAPL